MSGAALGGEVVVVVMSVRVVVVHEANCRMQRQLLTIIAELGKSTARGPVAVTSLRVGEERYALREWVPRPAASSRAPEPSLTRA